MSQNNNDVLALLRMAAGVQPYVPGSWLQEDWSARRFREVIFKMLTPREREVAGVAWRPDQEIATELGISRTAIRSHLKRAYSKLGIRSRVELVRIFTLFIG